MNFKSVIFDKLIRVFRFLQKHSLKFLTISCLTLYFFILLLTKFDEDYHFQWHIFWIYIVTLVSIFIVFLNKSVGKYFKKKINKIEIFSLGIIFVISMFIGFLYLLIYPYVSIGDELRDAGLNAQRVISGRIKEFFAFGDYSGYGNIIPVIGSFFYKIFGTTVVTYRLPSTLIFVLDSVLFYVLLRLHFTQLVALIGSLVYVALPLHIYFARSELVVAFDSFWTVVILLAFSLWLRNRQPINYIFLGTVLGTVSQFHTAVRVVAVLIFGITLLMEFMTEKQKILRNKIASILLLLLFCFIGFGPTILYSNASTFFQNSRYAIDLQEKKSQTITQRIEKIKDDYVKSFMVWGYESTTTKYAEHKPILPFFLAILFFLGIGYSLFGLRNIFFNVLLFLAFVLPFTNSAMTDMINADHRLAPLFPIGAIFITLGIVWLRTKIFSTFIWGSVVFCLLIYLSVIVFTFFNSYSANGNAKLEHFVTMHTIYFIQKQFSSPSLTSNNAIENNNICLVISPDNNKNMHLKHSQEQFAYFIPSKNITLQEAKDLQNNEAYIYNGDCPRNYKQTKQIKKTSCKNKSFYCPLNYSGDIILHY